MVTRHNVLSNINLLLTGQPAMYSRVHTRSQSAFYTGSPDIQECYVEP